MKLPYPGAGHRWLVYREFDELHVEIVKPKLFRVREEYSAKFPLEDFSDEKLLEVAQSLLDNKNERESFLDFQKQFDKSCLPELSKGYRWKYTKRPKYMWAILTLYKGREELGHSAWVKGETHGVVNELFEIYLKDLEIDRRISNIKQ